MCRPAGPLLEQSEIDCELDCVGQRPRLGIGLLDTFRSGANVGQQPRAGNACDCAFDEVGRNQTGRPIVTSAEFALRAASFVGICGAAPCTKTTGSVGEPPRCCLAVCVVLPPQLVKTFQPKNARTPGPRPVS